MRKATLTCIAASVALAMAGTAHAITQRFGAPTPPTVATTAPGTSTTSGTGTNAGSTTTTGTTSATTSGTTTGTTGAGTTTAAGNTTTTGATAGTSQVGTSSGSALVDAQNRNLDARFDTRGTTSASQSSTTATAGVNGTGVGTTTIGSTTTGGDVFGRGAGVIVTDNGTGSAGIVNNMNANGERMATSVDMSSLSPNAVEAPAVAVQQAPSSMVASEVNVLERRELYKRRNAATKRDRQLLYSIAPRTNVNRADQAPDDPISPAITPPR